MLHSSSPIVCLEIIQIKTASLQAEEAVFRRGMTFLRWRTLGIM
jgi:hypothetical protein